MPPSADLAPFAELFGYVLCSFKWISTCRIVVGWICIEKNNREGVGRGGGRRGWGRSRPRGGKRVTNRPERYADYSLVVFRTAAVRTLTCATKPNNIQENEMKEGTELLRNESARQRRKSKSGSSCIFLVIGNEQTRNNNRRSSGFVVVVQSQREGGRRHISQRGRTTRCSCCCWLEFIKDGTGGRRRSTGESRLKNADGKEYNPPSPPPPSIAIFCCSKQEEEEEVDEGERI